MTCLSTRMHHPDPQQTSICSYSLLNVACLAQRHPELLAPFPKRKISGTPRAFPQVKNIRNSRLSPSEKACFTAKLILRVSKDLNCLAFQYFGNDLHQIL
jgi:hypothetical protein